MRNAILAAALVLAISLAITVQVLYPGKGNPPTRPTCSDYWDKVYTLECDHG